MAEPLKRFCGAAAWRQLTADQQDDIGALALEFALAVHSQDTCQDQEFSSVRARSSEAAVHILMANLSQAAILHLDGSVLDDQPIPSLLGQVCRECGCSHHDPCEEGCGWAENDLCTA